MSKTRRKHVRKSKKKSNNSSPIDWVRLANRLQLVLAMVVPFFFLEELFNYVDLPRAVLIQTGVVLILLVWLMGAILRNECQIIRTPFDLPLLCFVSWASLSLLWAHNFYLGFEIGIQWSACLILFFLTTNLSRSERDVRQLLGTLLLAGTLVAVLGICQYLLEVNWVPQIVPPAATFANRNMAAQFMVVTIPLAVGFFLLSRKRNHVLLIVVVLGVLGLFLFYAATRSAWLAVAVELLLLAMLLVHDHFRWKLAPPIKARKTKALAVCAVVVFIFINLTPSGFQWQVGSAYDRIGEVLPGAQPGPVQISDEVAPVSVEDAAQAQPVQATLPRYDSLSVRMRLWQNTLQMGKEHFVRGVGLGNFPVLYPRYVRSAVVDPVLSETEQWGRAHNDYAQTFAELGIVGLFFLGWILFALIKISLALLGRETEEKQRYLMMGVLLALSGLSITAFFSFPFQMATPTFIFALYLGVLGGHYSRRQLQDENSVSRGKVFLSPPSWAFKVGVALTLLLLLTLLPLQFNRLKADGYYKRVEISSRAGDWEAVISQAREGYQYYPYQKKFLFAQGRGYLAMGNFEAAIEAMEEFLEAYPNYTNAHHNVALAYARKGETDLALQHFDRVFEITPGYGLTHFEVAQLYAKRNELDEALEHYRLAVKDEGNNARFLGRLGSAALTQELFSEAQEALEKALKNDPDNSVYYLDLGIAAAKLRKPEEARVAFGKSVELNPQSAVAHYNLGMLLFRVFEEREEGIEHLEKALNLELSATYAAQARELIGNDRQQ